MKWQESYERRFYDRSRGWVDGTQEFHDLCAAVLPRGGSFLELGAGPTNRTSQYLASLGDVHGLDPDPDVKSNTALSSAAVLDSDRFPFEDAYFDGCVSNFVLEHVADPELHLGEVRRVLRPDAAYVFRTPNLFHYVTLISAITPHRIHLRMANRLRNLPAESHEPYPTCYRLNSRGAIRREARRARLEVESLRLIEKEPSYGMSSRLLFLTFMAYERVVNSTELLAALRSNILCILRKPRGED